MVKVVLFFGVPGSGKSFIAKNLAPTFNAYFYEADDDFKDEYRERGKVSKEEAQIVKNEFYGVVISKIRKYLESNKLIFIASALGKNKFRHKFIEEFKDEILFVLVIPDKEKILDFIFKRELPTSYKSENELREDLKSHLENKYASFEIPDFEHVLIDNDYSSEVLNIAHLLIKKNLISSFD